MQIQQILVNLIRNAVEALASADAAGRRLSIAARRVAANRQVEIRITDTGPGIDPAVEKRLFEPFVTSKPAGMGIGLSVCRRLAEAHGGSVDLAPGSPGGAIATLTLPALPET